MRKHEHKCRRSKQQSLPFRAQVALVDANRHHAFEGECPLLQGNESLRPSAEDGQRFVPDHLPNVPRARELFRQKPGTTSLPLRRPDGRSSEPRKRSRQTCAGAIVCRGESRLSRSTSPAPQKSKSGSLGTTLPLLSLSQSSGRIRRNPTGNCR